MRPGRRDRGRRGAGSGAEAAAARVHRYVRHPHHAQAAQQPRGRPGADPELRGTGAAHGRPRPRRRVQRRGRLALGDRLPAGGVRGGGPGGRIDHQRAGHRRLHRAEGVRRRRQAGRQAGGQARDRQHPLPQRPRPGHRQHPGRHPGRSPPGGGHRQRARRACRKRLARRGGDGAAHAPGPVPIGHDRRRDRAADRHQPAGQLPDRHPGAAEQERGGRQRLRARVGHSPGRLPEEPADLRDHDARSRSGSRARP